MLCCTVPSTALPPFPPPPSLSAPSYCSALSLPRRPSTRHSTSGDTLYPLETSVPYRPAASLAPSLLKQGAYNALVGAGITLFDTSDVYGYKSVKAGFSAEQLLGRFAEENVRFEEAELFRGQGRGDAGRR